ncbi:ribosomal protein L4 [Calocera cornea HHB12733]|uniref:Large ribosomal subunit protein uL4m n=1 Tax=Calocera cornea HHB12733 TaxID=1353952 RepID=A0A165F0X2_9BASI|nr:ribosomal protein L4 [Calocera cornea HHB12733]
MRIWWSVLSVRSGSDFGRRAKWARARAPTGSTHFALPPTYHSLVWACHSLQSLNTSSGAMFALLVQSRRAPVLLARRAFSSSQLARASVEPGGSSLQEEADLSSAEEDPAERWLATTSISELRSISVVKAAPWEPKPVHIPLSSLLTRQPNQPRASSNVIALEPSVFDHPIRRDILHLCVNYYRDGLRQGTASTKNRAEVSGSGKKLRPQKGSGRARLGDRGNPMLRGGGRAFGPKPRDFSTALPKKMVEMGLRVALTAKLREHALGVVETLKWPGVKTGEFRRKVSSLGWKKVLFIAGADEVPANLVRSSNNLQGVACTTAKDTTVYDLLKWPTVVMDVAAVDWFHRHLAKAPLAIEDISGPLPPMPSVGTEGEQLDADGAEILHRDNAETQSSEALI